MDADAERRARQNAAKQARLKRPPPPGMYKCVTGPHDVNEDDIFFCPVADLGIHEFKGQRGRIQRRFCKKHFAKYLEGQKRHRATDKRKASNNANKLARMHAPVQDGMGRCRVGPHHVPLCELTFCPVTDLGMTSYKGTRGALQRQYCKRHFAGYRANQNRHGHTESRKEQTRLFLIQFRTTGKYKTYQAQPCVRKARRITSMHRQAKQRGIEYKLSPEMEQAIVDETAVCFHCGRANAPYLRGLYAEAEEDGFRPLGPDRLDNDGIYEDDNVVPCCTLCNFARRNLAVDDFYQACQNVVAFVGLGISTTTHVPWKKNGNKITTSSSYEESVYGATRRRIAHHLTRDEYEALCAQSCYLCGSDVCVGVDRMDSNGDYTLANARPCCTTCNMMKNRFAHDEFLDMCRAVTRVH